MEAEAKPAEEAGNFNTEIEKAKVEQAQKAETAAAETEAQDVVSPRRRLNNTDPKSRRTSNARRSRGSEVVQLLMTRMKELEEMYSMMQQQHELTQSRLDAANEREEQLMDVLGEMQNHTNASETQLNTQKETITQLQALLKQKDSELNAVQNRETEILHKAQAEVATMKTELKKKENVLQEVMSAKHVMSLELERKADELSREQGNVAQLKRELRLREQEAEREQERQEERARTAANSPENNVKRQSHYKEESFASQQHDAFSEFF